MALFKVPSAFPFLFRDLCWKIPATEKVLYLTFDDGPEPAVTPYVLDLLKRYNARATFFCIGKNVAQHPSLYSRIKEEGHATGNHTYSHLKGWITRTNEYLKDVKACADLVDSRIFRPPYGKISYSQYRKISRDYCIVLWDIITHDYDKHLDVNKAVKACISSANPGSVIVFHDSLKAQRNLEVLLPAILEHFSKEGYTFSSLSEDLCRKAIA